MLRIKIRDLPPNYSEVRLWFGLIGKCDRGMDASKLLQRLEKVLKGNVASADHGGVLRRAVSLFNPFSIEEFIPFISV